MPKLGFRAIADDDRDFLISVYATTRAEELALVDWSDERKQQFVAMQFSAQDSYYREHYQQTDFLLILLDQQPIGRFYLARWTNEFRIAELSILPEYRNAGYGTQILNNVLTEAEAAGKPVTIHVERYNPAQNLYRRLGFAKIGEHGVYDLMQWPNDQQR